MAAALSGADEPVKLLLFYGADPDLMDNVGHTAMIAAITGGVHTTVSIVAPVTRAGQNSCLSGTISSPRKVYRAAQGICTKVCSRYGGS